MPRLNTIAPLTKISKKITFDQFYSLIINAKEKLGFIESIHLNALIKALSDNKFQITRASLHANITNLRYLKNGKLRIMTPDLFITIPREGILDIFGNPISPTRTCHSLRPNLGDLTLKALIDSFRGYLLNPKTLAAASFKQCLGITTCNDNILIGIFGVINSENTSSTWEDLITQLLFISKKTDDELQALGVDALLKMKLSEKILTENGFLSVFSVLIGLIKGTIDPQFIPQSTAETAPFISTTMTTTTTSTHEAESINTYDYQAGGDCEYNSEQFDDENQYSDNQNDIVFDISMGRPVRDFSKLDFTSFNSYVSEAHQIPQSTMENSDLLQLQSLQTLQKQYDDACFQNDFLKFTTDAMQKNLADCQEQQRILSVENGCLKNEIATLKQTNQCQMRENMQLHNHIASLMSTNEMLLKEFSKLRQPQNPIYMQNTQHPSEHISNVERQSRTNMIPNLNHQTINQSQGYHTGMRLFLPSGANVPETVYAPYKRTHGNEN